MKRIKISLKKLKKKIVKEYKHIKRDHVVRGYFKNNTLFVVFVLFSMVSMCNHSLKESSGVGIESTIKSHGD